MSSKVADSCVAKVPIFQKLTEDELKEIILIAKHSKYSKDDMLYAAGDRLDALYVVNSGQVKINKYTYDGKEQILRVLEHGDFLGEAALFDEQVAKNNAEMLNDVEICRIDRSDFSKILDKVPSIAVKMLKELYNRLESTEDVLTFSTLKSSEAKLAKFLLDEAKDNVVRFKTTKKTIAANLSMTPETFSRKLRQFEDEKYIKIISNKEVEILDHEMLEELLEA